MDLDLELIESISRQVQSGDVFSLPARARQTQAEVSPLQYVRDLTPADVEMARSCREEIGVFRGGSIQRLHKIRHAHHQLARLCAEGVRDVQIAAMTGYSVPHLHTLRRDPLFQELVAYYKAGVEAQYLSVHERRGEIGALAMEHLRERLEDDVEAAKISTKTMMELAEFGQGDKIKAQAMQDMNASRSSGVQVNISFPQQVADGSGRTAPVVIEGKVVEASSE